MLQWGPKVRLPWRQNRESWAKPERQNWVDECQWLKGLSLFLYLILSQIRGEVGWLSYFDEKLGVRNIGNWPHTVQLLCMYVCVDACMHARMRSCVFMNVWKVILYYSPHYFWGSHGAHNSAFCLDWLSRKSQGSFCLCFPSIGIVGVCCHAQLFMWVLNLGPHTCVLSTLLTESSPWSII